MNLLDNLRASKAEIKKLDPKSLKIELDNFLTSIDSEIQVDNLYLTGAKFVYFLNSNILYLGGKLSSDNSELEESLLVKLEIDLQLLTSQILRSQESSLDQKEYHRAVLEKLLEKIYLDTILLLSKLEIKFSQRRETELVVYVQDMINYVINELPVKTNLQLDSHNFILNKLDL